ncbi:MAG: MATE family efflux transporter [Ruminobacter sp.]|uniref:MATE family efflux transporter n=1 Tax=Ruminobacter sp. TaxID=2774296 RepID=UPI0025808020|nr:MATE family efflux transporter [Ruminobacter sp.]MBQ3776314.1 MATE family efflux transporter [Ruminobacter sp.]
MSRKDTGKILASMLKSTEYISCGAKIRLILAMAFPAMCAQISQILMHYIDASMVGQLGPLQSAAVGLVSSSIWLIGGICLAVVSGFAVQVAQNIGACKLIKARAATSMGFFCLITLSLLLSVVSAVSADRVPYILGGTEDIAPMASSYFLIYMCAFPVLVMNMYAASLLQATGNIRTPSLLNIGVCILDVIFNFIFIFPTRRFEILGCTLTLPGFHMGITGAAAGTALAEGVICVIMLWMLLVRNEQLHIRREKLYISPPVIFRAFRISAPICLDHLATTGAMVASVAIVSVLGTRAIAAHSFAITAESFCYMIGYGTAFAGTSVIGQCVGARRRDLARNFTVIITVIGVGMMTLAAVVMYVTAPVLIGLLTPDEEIRELGTAILRIEAFAEPLYGASILIAGCMRGAGDTMIPGLMNSGTMWLIRIPLSLLLVKTMGLQGVWVAMALELCIRGCLFLLRLRGDGWLKACDRKKSTV